MPWAPSVYQVVAPSFDHIERDSGCGEFMGVMVGTLPYDVQIFTLNRKQLLWSVVMVFTRVCFFFFFKHR